MMTEYDDYIKGIEEALSFADSVVGRYEGDANIQRYNLWVKRRGELRDLLARAREVTKLSPLDSVGIGPTITSTPLVKQQVTRVEVPIGEILRETARNHERPKGPQPETIVEGTDGKPTPTLVPGSGRPVYGTYDDYLNGAGEQ